MKPYNCNCLYEVQVRELKQQKDELLEALRKISQMSDSGSYLNSLLDCKKIATDLITKYSNNGNT